MLKKTGTSCRFRVAPPDGGLEQGKWMKGQPCSSRPTSGARIEAAHGLKPVLCTGGDHAGEKSSTACERRGHPRVLFLGGCQLREQRQEDPPCTGEKRVEGPEEPPGAINNKEKERVLRETVRGVRSAIDSVQEAIFGRESLEDHIKVGRQEVCRRIKEPGKP
ncbi:hypothetical protein GOP47_0029676 [Adiantum capillus-veneris]|nr:hypothetical protein GOP47_0029676 [Adiantum capillus-veneris]